MKRDLWSPEDYRRHNGPQRSWQNELLSIIEGETPERILDIGCGDGRLAAELAGRFDSVREVVGVDVSAAMIEGARLRGAPRTRFECLSFLDCAPENVGTFDLILSTAALHWIADQPGVVRTVSRLLVDGGRFCADMGGEHNIDRPLELAETLRREPPYAEHFPADWLPPWVWPSAEEYRGWLADNELDGAVEALRRDGDYADREAIVGWLATTWLPYHDVLPGALWGPFVETLADRLLVHGLEAHNRDLFVRLRIDARRRPRPVAPPPILDV